MKLSEAIRLGATLKPQAFGDYYAGVGSCALGAAFDAAGIIYLPGREDEERSLLPVGT